MKKVIFKWSGELVAFGSYDEAIKYALGEVDKGNYVASKPRDADDYDKGCEGFRRCYVVEVRKRVKGYLGGW